MQPQSPPEEDRDLIIQHSELAPLDSADPPSCWTRFLDALRQAIGLKPIYLAECFVKAKVRQENAKAMNEESEAQARLWRAKQDYETAVYQARLAESKAKGQLAKDQADARLTRSKARLNETLVNILREDLTPEEAMERLTDTITRIQMHGGVVEFVLPKLRKEQGDE